MNVYECQMETITQVSSQKTNLSTPQRNSRCVFEKQPLCKKNWVSLKEITEEIDNWRYYSDRAIDKQISKFWNYFFYQKYPICEVKNNKYK